MAGVLATDDQRHYLQSLAWRLENLLSGGDPLAARIVREAKRSDMDTEYADRLIRATEDAVRALEGGNVTVGPWGEQYE